MSQLNPNQRAAVRHIDGPLLVLAGAGSGKTRVITTKIAYLIEECGRDARHIAAVTFTNKAAREMKSRVSKLLPADRLKGLRVSTFHTLGLDIIRRELKLLGYKSGFSIYDAQDSASLIKELMRKAFGDAGDQAERVLWQISRWKNALRTPAEALEEANREVHLTAAARLYEEYNHYLKTYNAVDFDDLIMLPVMLFREHREALERWQQRIRYLLVDEYQDTNATQYELVKLLVGPRSGLTVVGDDDQSIYAWRGAQPENLTQLQEDFHKLKVIKLEQNYRSMGNILKCANILIANNPHVFDKALWSELGYGEPLKVLIADNEQHEAEKIVSRILAHRFNKRTGYRDYAILYRGNHQSRVFEQALREHDIPYYLSGGRSFFEYSEIKDIMAYLRLITNLDDDNALLRIVNTPRREIGPGTMEKLAGYAASREIGLIDACFEMGLGEFLSARALERVTRFARWIVELGDRAAEDDPIAIVRDLLEDIGYSQWLRDTSKDETVAERRIANVEELLAWLQRMARNDDGKTTLAELVAKVALMDLLERQEDENDLDRVNLMTLHAAKGLEFPHVFMVGMEEEILPHRTSIEEDNLEEERRLAYVGITRAQRTLSFSYTKKRKRYGEVIQCSPSRFLFELPQDDLAWDNAPKDPAEQKIQGQAHLENLRKMLGG